MYERAIARSFSGLTCHMKPLTAEKAVARLAATCSSIRGKFFEIHQEISTYGME